jgi:hypothetical protein
MLLAPTTRRRTRDKVRHVVRTARETYRRRRHPAATAEWPVRAPAGERDPDVVLDVPRLEIAEIDLELDELQARVALDARVLDMLGLHVGADASLGRVNLTIKGVEAQALLKVRLDNLARIVDRLMDTVDRNPEILGRLADGVGGVVGDIGRGAGGAIEQLPGTVAGDRRSRSSPR